MNHAQQVYEKFCHADRERILTANPTMDQLIADYSYYRFYYAAHQASRIAGGKGKLKHYQPQMDYLIDALFELQRLHKDPSLPNLKEWVEKDNPHQIFTNYRLGKAIDKFNLLIASKSADKET